VERYIYSGAEKEENNMNVLVTGGAGFIGSNLSAELARLGHAVTAVDNLSSARTDHEQFFKSHSEIELVEGCFASEPILSRVSSGEFDVVFHNAAIPRVSYSVENPSETTDANVAKTVRLLEACRGNIKRFVFASSSSVYGGADVLPTPPSHPKDPKSPYAWQKSCMEDLIRLFCSLYDMDAVCLRYFNVFGPGQFGDSPYSTAVSAWCHAIKHGLPLRSDGTGEQTRDMCYIDNVVSANILAMNYDSRFSGQCLNVACESRVSNNEILAALSEKFDFKVNHAPPRPGDVMHTLADIRETKWFLGYEPLVHFWEGLEKTIEWWGLEQSSD
jgi:UDP-glucose 4-epimerase